MNWGSIKMCNRNTHTHTRTPLEWMTSWGHSPTFLFLSILGIKIWRVALVGYGELGSEVWLGNRTYITHVIYITSFMPVKETVFRCKGALKKSSHCFSFHCSFWILLSGTPGTKSLEAAFHIRQQATPCTLTVRAHHIFHFFNLHWQSVWA